MLILIDGPNGSGKDYCISKIITYCKSIGKSVYPVSIKSVITSDVLDKKIRGRDELSIDNHEIMGLYTSHVKLLDTAKILLEDYDVVVINRFLPSFYVYQHKLLEDTDSGIGFNVVLELAKHYVSELNEIEHTILHVDADLDTLINRLFLRDGVVDVEKISKIHKSYQRHKEDLGGMFYNTIYVTSDNFNPETIIPVPLK